MKKKLNKIKTNKYLLSLIYFIKEIYKCILNFILSIINALIYNNALGAMSSIYIMSKVKQISRSMGINQEIADARKLKMFKDILYQYKTNGAEAAHPLMKKVVDLYPEERLYNSSGEPRIKESIISAEEKNALVRSASDGNIFLQKYCL